MAVVASTSSLFLELDGRDAGALRSAQPASVRVDMVVHDVGQGLVVRGQPCVPTDTGRRMCQHTDRVRLLDNGAAMVDASNLSFDHAVAVDPLVVERLEVLRGPAALLYGGNATGGVVNVITAKPTDQFEANARAEYGNFNAIRLRGMLNVPIFEDKLAVRLSGATLKPSGANRARKRATRRIRTGSSANAPVTWRSTRCCRSSWPPWVDDGGAGDVAGLGQRHRPGFTHVIGAGGTAGSQVFAQDQAAPVQRAAEDAFGLGLRNGAGPRYLRHAIVQAQGVILLGLVIGIAFGMGGQRQQHG